MLWSIEDVGRWLQSKGFDQFICDKFNGASSSRCSNISQLHMRRTEHLIDGDALRLVNEKMMMDHMGIKALGLLLKIMEAIKVLFPREYQCYVASTAADVLIHSSDLSFTKSPPFATTTTFLSSRTLLPWFAPY
jgi:hypothetical protein